MEPGFPGDCWTPDCPWEAMDKFLTLLSCVAFALPIELAYLYLNPWFFSPFPSASLPHPTDRMRKQVWGAELSVRVNSKNPKKTPLFLVCLIIFRNDHQLLLACSVKNQMWQCGNRSFIVIFYFLLEKQMASFAHIKSNPSLELKLIICHDFHIPCAYRNTNYLVTHLTILPNIFTYNSGWRCNREKWFILMTTIQH